MKAINLVWLNVLESLTYYGDIPYDLDAHIKEDYFKKILVFAKNQNISVKIMKSVAS